MGLAEVFGQPHLHLLQLPMGFHRLGEPNGYCRAESLMRLSCVQPIISVSHAKIGMSTAVNPLILTTVVMYKSIQAQHPKKHKNVKILTTSSQPSKVKRHSPLNPTSAAMPSLMWFNAPKQKNE